ncbi:MAG: nitroreductase family protein [Treponema sp.]
MFEITERRSIRKYKAVNVDKEKIAELIESARLAPSGNNTQPWHFILIDDKEVIADIAEAAHNQKWIASAPLIIVCVADLNARIKDSDEFAVDENSSIFEVKQIIRDTAIAVEHIVLEAVHLGLGSCWVSWFTQDDIKKLLNIPQNKFVVTLLTIGLPDESPEQRPRKKTEDIIHMNKW